MIGALYYAQTIFDHIADDAYISITMNKISIYYIVIILLRSYGNGFCNVFNTNRSKRSSLTFGDCIHKVNEQQQVSLLSSSEGDHVPSNKNYKSSSFSLLNAQLHEERRNLPFSMIVNQDHIKQALLLLATNPRGIGGVMISGRHGTGKVGDIICCLLTGNTFQISDIINITVSDLINNNW